MNPPARRPRRSLPKVGDRFRWRGVEWQVSYTSQRFSRNHPIQFIDFTLCLDRVSRALSRRKGRKR